MRFGKNLVRVLSAAEPVASVAVALVVCVADPVRPVVLVPLLLVQQVQSLADPVPLPMIQQQLPVLPELGVPPADRCACLPG